jgi:glycosyltransferase involved in cell wall biosynthesis
MTVKYDLRMHISSNHICLLISARIFEIQYGGVEKFTLSLARWLTRHGYDVSIMASTFANVKVKSFSDFSENSDLLRKPNKVKALHPPYIIFALSQLFLSFLWILNIIALNARHPLTLIHAQDTGYAGLAAIIAGKILGIPVILSSHAIRHVVISTELLGTIYGPWVLSFEYRLDLFTIKKADKVIAVNPEIKDYFEKRVNKKIDFIPNPIDLGRFSFQERNRISIRKELGIADNDIVVGFVGRFTQVKNVSTLIRSFSDFARDNEYAKLLLVGDGPLSSQLKEFAHNNGITHKVIFCGVRNDIHRILSGIDIFVLNSYSEGMSIAILEAMAAAKPIICSDIPANRELLSVDDALFVDPDDPKMLTKLIRVLSNDKELRSKLAERSMNKAKNYDEAMVFPKFIKCYKDLLMAL